MRFIFMKAEKMLFEKRPINFTDFIIPKKLNQERYIFSKKERYIFILQYMFIQIYTYVYILMKGAGYFRNTLKSNATTEKICFAF